MTQARDSADAGTTHATPRCPYCGATTVEPLALFGAQLLTVQMYCQACHTPFEYVKDDAVLEAFEARKGNQP